MRSNAYAAHAKTFSYKNYKIYQTNMVVNCKETIVSKGVAIYSATYISVGQGIRNEGSH